MFLKHTWEGAGPVEGVTVLCPHCGAITTPLGLRDAKTVVRSNGMTARTTRVYACSSCTYPFVHLMAEDQFIPSPRLGASVKNLPVEMETLYNEARDSSGVGAYTACAMLARKVLMNLAVLEGADENKSFLYYVNYLAENGFVPKKGKPWVDKIRQMGNEATHEIQVVTAEDAKDVLFLVENLLRFNFEMIGASPP